MKKIITNYKSTIILLISIIVGGFAGIIFKDKVSILKPFGDLFVNLLLISVIPLIFISISTSICKINKPSRFKKIFIYTFLIFIFTSLVALLISFLVTKNINLVESSNIKKITDTFDYTLISEPTEINFLEKTVSLISTNDFINLFSIDNMLALIVFSILFGISISKSKKNGKKTIELLESLNSVIINYINLVMCYAPVGLSCYFACLIGNLGTTIVVGYLKTFVFYMIVSAIVYFVIYSLYAYFSAGKKGVSSFWKNIIPSSLTSLGTCSSAASVPTNILCTKNIGVPSDIAETTVSLGTSFHKDGSTIGSVFKIMFLVSLFNNSTMNINFTFKILGVALIATLLISAVPLGGGTISELLIISMMGYPIAALPILTIIAAVIDAPATLLNVTGDSAAAMLITRCVEGKNWLNNERNI